MQSVFSRMGKRVARCLVLVAAFATLLPAAAFATPENGWDITADGERYWYENGVMARNKEVYNPLSEQWYWFDADGTMARDKDVYLPAGNKWVRYDSYGHMVKGEDCRYGGWYWFDMATGAMAKGFKCIPADDGGYKWVFYDYTTGQMAHGERLIDGSHGDEIGWMYFDDYTGAVIYGWKDLLDGRKVFYDRVTGRMLHGWQDIDGQSCYFDEYTGALTTPPASSGGSSGGESSGGSSSDQGHLTTVYVTENGDCYHRANCPTLWRSHPTAVSLSDALKMNRRRCNTCNP